MGILTPLSLFSPKYSRLLLLHTTLELNDITVIPTAKKKNICLVTGGITQSKKQTDTLEGASYRTSTSNFLRF